MVGLIRTLMSLRKVSQTELAQETGVSVTAISRYLNEVSDLRAEALQKILKYLGADLNGLMKTEINKALGHEDEFSIGEDIRFLLDQAPPITRKTVTETLISCFRSTRNADMKNRIKRLKRYKDSIRTVRRVSC